MQLNSVEACLFGKDEGYLELLLDRFNVLQCHFLWHWVVGISKCCDLLAILNGRRRPRLESACEGWMSDSACMKSLQEDDCSLLVHFFNDLLPAFNMLLVPKATLPRIPVSSL